MHELRQSNNDMLFSSKECKIKYWSNEWVLHNFVVKSKKKEHEISIVLHGKSPVNVNSIS